MTYYFPTSKDVEDSLSSLGFDLYTKRYYDANGLKYKLEAKTEDSRWDNLLDPDGRYITKFRGRFITKTGNEISTVFDTSKWSLEDIEEWMALTFEAGLFEYLCHENDMSPYLIEERHKNILIEKELSVTHKKLEDLSPEEWKKKKLEEEILLSHKNYNGWIPSIEEITLLSVKEAKSLPESILKAQEQYWLKDPGFNVNSVTNMNCFCRNINDGGRIVKNCVGCKIDDGGRRVKDSLYVRPVLRISNLNKLNLNIGDTVRIFGLNWVLISPDKVFSEKVIFQEIFRRDFKAPNSTDYEASDVKRSLEKWLKEQKAAFYDSKIHREDLLIRRPEAVNIIRDIIKDTVDCDKMYFVFHKNNEPLKSNGYQELFFDKKVAEYFATLIDGRVQEMEIVKAFLVDETIKDLAEFNIDGEFVSGWEINEAIRAHFKDRNLQKAQIREYLQKPLGVWASQKDNNTIIFTYNGNLVLFSDIKKLNAFDKSRMPDGELFGTNIFKVDYEDLIQRMKWGHVFFDGEQHCTSELFLEVLKEEKEKLKFKDFINQPENAFEFRYSSTDPSKNVNIDKANEIFKESGFELINGNWVWNP